MWASQPQDLNWASMNSALALSWAVPTWLGSDAICFIQADISLGSIWASKAFSTAASSARPVCFAGEAAAGWTARARARAAALTPQLRCESLRTTVMEKASPARGPGRGDARIRSSTLSIPRPAGQGRTNKFGRRGSERPGGGDGGGCADILLPGREEKACAASQGGESGLGATPLKGIVGRSKKKRGEPRRTPKNSKKSQGDACPRARPRRRRALGGLKAPLHAGKRSGPLALLRVL